jgi:hypothetical protein
MENELQDLLASLKTKLKKDPSLQSLADKAESKLNQMIKFMADARLKIADWDILEVSDVVPDKVLEEVESLINEQVGYSEGAKIAKKKISAVM